MIAATLESLAAELGRQAATLVITADQLEAEFAERGVKSGGVLALKPTDALELVNRARSAGIRILGLDAFEITPDSWQPFIEHSCDFSLARRPLEDPWTAAEQHLKRYWDSHYLFEVVLSDAPVA